MSVVSSQVIMSNQVSAQIAENTLALVREELDARCARMRRLGIGAATAMGLTWIAMSLTQIALLVLAMSPLFAATFQAHTVAACALPVTLLAILAWTMTVRSWGILLDDKQRPSVSPAPTPDLQYGATQKH